MPIKMLNLIPPRTSILVCFHALLLSKAHVHNGTVVTDETASNFVPTTTFSWARMKTSIVGEIKDNSMFQTMHFMDLLLFASVILAALELLNCLVKVFGSKYNSI